MGDPQRRLTQRDVARIAKVSQTTVSVVLNGREVSGIRISPETRQRVLDVIRETGYVADPIARRMTQRENRLLGVFTYERVFPTASADFYGPFLEGIEARAEQATCDLLLFTSAKTGSGRRIYDDNRLGLADGSLLLGREIPKDELARLIADGYPLACVGRRDDAGGPVPYVGADYAAATATFVREAMKLGHRETAYVGVGQGAESAGDRIAGFYGGGGHHHLADDKLTGARLLDALLVRGVTAAFLESHSAALGLIRAARLRGVDVPGDLSVIALGDPLRGPTQPGLTGFRIPRRDMGAQAVEVLLDLIAGKRRHLQRLLPCENVRGDTLAAPRSSSRQPRRRTVRPD